MSNFLNFNGQVQTNRTNHFKIKSCSGFFFKKKKYILIYFKDKSIANIQEFSWFLMLKEYSIKHTINFCPPPQSLKHFTQWRFSINIPQIVRSYEMANWNFPCICLDPDLVWVHTCKSIKAHTLKKKNFFF